MKKILSLFLAITMIVSMFAGCAMGIGDNPMPTRPTEEQPTTSDETEPNPDALYVTGMFYRTESGVAVLLSKDVGPLVLHNDVSEFEDIMNFAIIKAETDVIMESYPAQTTITNWGVTNSATIIEDYKDMVQEMSKMGYVPEEPFGEEGTKPAAQMLDNYNTDDEEIETE